MKKLPKILLVGAGRFGQHHLRVLKKLEAEGKIELVGVVTKHQGPKLDQALLKKVSGVVIVTPPRTHYSLVKKCLPFTDVFVEKPLALEPKQAQALSKLARRYKRVLFVGHIYRYHPVVHKLQKILRSENPKQVRISGRFVSPLSTWKKENPAFEKLHFFDVIDYLWPTKLTSVWTKWQSRSLLETSLRYQNGVTALFTLGWQPGETKERTLDLVTPQACYHCDLSAGWIEREVDGQKEKINCPLVIEPLEAEHLAFLGALAGKKTPIPDGAVGSRIVEIAGRVGVSARVKAKPEVAVIGGGIFGLTVALWLAKRYQVTVLERERDILEGASRKNQYRHHVGYHYPRSLETIKEIARSTKDFEGFYRDFIIRDFPSYYAVAKSESRVSAEQFVSVCDEAHLPYEVEFPESELLNREAVSTCLRTSEAVLDYEALKKWLKRKIAANKNISLKLKSEVTGAKLAPTGQKILTMKTPNGRRSSSYDYVINVTYANYNQFCGWLNFPKRNLELRFKEVIVAKLPIPQEVRAAVTVMDGPFATIVPLGRTGLFTFGDVPLSVHSVAGGEGGEVVFSKLKRQVKSRWEAMQERCRQWFPILDKMEYVESMFVTLPVEKSALGTDARPTEITAHGFGCWSVLGGKIVTSVTTAKELGRQLGLS